MSMDSVRQTLLDAINAELELNRVARRDAVAALDAKQAQVNTQLVELANLESNVKLLRAAARVLNELATDITNRVVTPT